MVLSIGSKLWDELSLVTIRIYEIINSLGWRAKCVPIYQDPASHKFVLASNPGATFPWYAVSLLLWLHTGAQGAVFVLYLKDHGVGVQSCLHLVFVVIYCFSIIMSGTILRAPGNFLKALNETQTLNRVFRSDWERHPFSILVFFYLGPILVAMPAFTLVLFWMNPYGPMYLLSFCLGSSFRPYTFWLKLLGGIAESFLTWIHMLELHVVALACFVGVMCLNIWLADIQRLAEGLQQGPSAGGLWARSRQLQKVQRALLFLKYLQLYNRIFNEFWSHIIIPGSAVLAVALLVASAFATVTLHGVLNPAIYLFFPTLMVFLVLGVIAGVYGQLANIFQKSSRLQRHLQIRILHLVGGHGVVRRSDELLHTVNSIPAFGVRASWYGKVTLQTQVGMVEQSINYFLLLLNA